jgi:hypothetical protein
MTKRAKAVAENDEKPGDAALEELSAGETTHAEVIRQHAAAIEKPRARREISTYLAACLKQPPKSVRLSLLPHPLSHLQ